MATSQAKGIWKIIMGPDIKNMHLLLRLEAALSSFPELELNLQSLHRLVAGAAPTRARR